MKQYTHAWLAMMAMKRLQKTQTTKNNQKVISSLLKWFMNNRDSVIKGAWYPDAIIKDMATSHVLKYKPSVDNKPVTFRKLSGNYHIYQIGKKSSLYMKPYTIEGGNLPDRCESLTHSIVDNLKMQESEEKGSAISPTDNHIATIFFMLSHYVADAHMPLHCDDRPFSSYADIHAHIEKEWDDKIRDCYAIDLDNERFYYDKEGYPLKMKDDNLFTWIENEMATRTFYTTYGSGNNNTWDFMSAITQYSYLTAYEMIPAQHSPENLEWEEFLNMNNKYSFEEYSRYLLMDAIESIAKVWFRAWNRYLDWMKG